MQMRPHLTLVLVVMSALTACKREPPPPPVKQPVIDQKKFEPLYRSAKTVQASLDVGLTYAKLGDLLQAFATEISIAKDKASTPKETELVGMYRNALLTLQDSGLLWKHKLAGAGYDWIPDGRIFVEAELLPVVEKYEIPTKHERTSFSKGFTSIPEKSIQLVWAKAGEQLQTANKLYYAEETVAAK
jgi:hypothetical protein